MSGRSVAQHAQDHLHGSGYTPLALSLRSKLRASHAEDHSHPRNPRD
jgi:hypothetical protein